MNTKISSESLQNFRQPSSSVNEVKSFASLPRLVTSIIFQNLEFADKLSLRASSSGMKCHVDDHVRRKICKWIESVKLDKEKLSHQRILLAAIEQFVAMNFHPPYILKLIQNTFDIATSCHNIWREYETPMKIEEREKLLRVFYEEADTSFNEKEKKILFTLTILQLLQMLDPFFSIVHPFNKTFKLRVTFNNSHMFFAIPFYNFAFDWFEFDRDWIQVLLMIVKFVEIKAAMALANHVKWVNLVKPVNFDYASIFFGKKNPCSKVNNFPRVKATVRIKANDTMIGEIKRFLVTGKFNWEKAAENFDIEFKFVCVRARISKI